MRPIVIKHKEIKFTDEQQGGEFYFIIGLLLCVFCFISFFFIPKTSYYPLFIPFNPAKSFLLLFLIGCYFSVETIRKAYKKAG